MFVLECDTYRRRRHNKTLKSDNNKQQKRKKQNEKETQTKESSRASCQPRMSAYFSLGATPPPPPLLVFPVWESNTLQCPPSELRALVPGSLIRNRTEMLATHSRNRLLVCSGIIGRTDRAKIKQNKKQTNKQKKTARTKEGLQGLIMDNTNLRSFQELAPANNFLFHYYFSDFLAKFFL